MYAYHAETVYEYWLDEHGRWGDFSNIDIGEPSKLLLVPKKVAGLMSGTYIVDIWISDGSLCEMERCNGHITELGCVYLPKPALGGEVQAIEARASPKLEMIGRMYHIILKLDHLGMTQCKIDDNDLWLACSYCEAKYSRGDYLHESWCVVGQAIQIYTELNSGEK